MSVQRTYHCESPDCHGGSLDNPEQGPLAFTTASGPPYLPVGLIETREFCDGKEHTHHFCSWDCCMKYAASQPVAEAIEI